MPVLTDPRKEAFAQHYAVHGIAARACQDAYDFTHNSRGTRGRKLLEDPQVAARVRELNEQQFREVGVTAERVKEELARCAFQSAADLFDDEGRLIPMQDLPDEVAVTISNIDVEVTRKPAGYDVNGDMMYEDVVVKKIRRVDKGAALALLARHFKVVGAEDDGVNALATALADRLNAAKRRLGEVVGEAQEVTDEAEPRMIDNAPSPVLDLPAYAHSASSPLQEDPDERLW